MTVSGTWKAGSEIKLDRHLVIPEGESLTIEPGVKIIVSTEGVGVNHTPIEIIVNGNLYVLGTEWQPVLCRAGGRNRSHGIVPGNGD